MTSTAKPPTIRKPEAAIENPVFSKELPLVLINKEESIKHVIVSSNSFDERISILIEKICSGQAAPKSDSSNSNCVEIKPIVDERSKENIFKSEESCNKEIVSGTEEKYEINLLTETNQFSDVDSDITTNEMNSTDQRNRRFLRSRQVQSVEDIDTQSLANKTPLSDKEDFTIESETPRIKHSLRNQSKTKSGVTLKIKLSDIKDKMSDISSSKEKRRNDKKLASCKKITSKNKKICQVKDTNFEEPDEPEESRTFVKSLRSRKRISYVEEQFDSFYETESSSDDDTVSCVTSNKNVISTKETQITENIFDCNVLINNIQVNQIKIKETEILQNVKVNNRRKPTTIKPSSTDGKGVLISKKSLRSVRSVSRIKEDKLLEDEESQRSGRSSSRAKEDEESPRSGKSFSRAKEDKLLEDEDSQRKVRSFSRAKEDKLLEDEESQRKVRSFSRAKDDRLLEDEESSRKDRSFSRGKDDKLLEDEESSRKVRSFSRGKEDKLLEDEESSRKVRSFSRGKEDKLLEDEESSRKVRSFSRVKDDKLLENEESSRKVRSFPRAKEDKILGDEELPRSGRSFFHAKEVKLLGDDESPRKVRSFSRAREDKLLGDEESSRSGRLFFRTKEDKLLGDEESLRSGRSFSRVKEDEELPRSGRLLSLIKEDKLEGKDSPRNVRSLFRAKEDKLLADEESPKGGRSFSRAKEDKVLENEESPRSVKSLSLIKEGKDSPRNVRSFSRAKEDKLLEKEEPPSCVKSLTLIKEDKLEGKEKTQCVTVSPNQPPNKTKDTNEKSTIRESSEITTESIINEVEKQPAPEIAESSPNEEGLSTSSHNHDPNKSFQTIFLDNETGKNNNLLQKNDLEVCMESSNTTCGNNDHDKVEVVDKEKVEDRPTIQKDLPISDCNPEFSSVSQFDSNQFSVKCPTPDNEAKCEDVDGLITSPGESRKVVTENIISASNISANSDVQNEVLTNNKTLIFHKKPNLKEFTKKRNISISDTEVMSKKMKSLGEPLSVSEIGINTYENEFADKEYELPLSNIDAKLSLIDKNSKTNIELSTEQSDSNVRAAYQRNTCEKAISADLSKTKYSIYPMNSTSNSSTPISIAPNYNKQMYDYFENFNKQLAMYSNTMVSNKKPNYYDKFYNLSAESEMSSQMHARSATTPSFASANSIRCKSIVKTKSVSSVSITPLETAVCSSIIVDKGNSEDMPIDLSKKTTGTENDTSNMKLVNTQNLNKNLKQKSDVQDICRRSTSTTPDCIVYKQSTRDRTSTSTTPESVCKQASSSTTPDSVYSIQETNSRTKNTLQSYGRVKTGTGVYDQSKQSPSQTMQMMHSKLWELQDLPYSLYDRPGLHEHLSHPQVISAPDVLQMQTLASLPEYQAQKATSFLLANQMYAEALAAFSSEVNTSKKVCTTNRKKPDSQESMRRKRVKDVMTHVQLPVLSYDQLQQSNIGLERRLEENVFQCQTSTSSQSTSVIQRTEVSDQSSLTYIQNSSNEKKDSHMPNILSNYPNLQPYGLNPNIVSQMQDISSVNRTTKAKIKLPRH